jgi:hypothetical protein
MFTDTGATCQQVRYVAQLEWSLEVFQDGEYVELPCLIGVTHFEYTPPDRGSRCSDREYYGYAETDWEILDMGGRPWAVGQAALTDRMRVLIEDHIMEKLGERP